MEFPLQVFRVRQGQLVQRGLQDLQVVVPLHRYILLCYCLGRSSFSGGLCAMPIAVNHNDHL